MALLLLLVTSAVLLLIAPTLLYIVYQYYMFYWSAYKNLPCKPPRLLFGNMYDIATDNSRLWLQLLQWHATWGRSGIFTIWFGHRPGVVLTAPQFIEPLLGSSELLQKDPLYDLMTGWLGRGLLTSLPAKWHVRRKMLTPAFHFNILDGFLPVFNEHADILAELLERAVGPQQVDICPLVTRCTLDIICETAMGKRIDAQRQPDSPYVQAVLVASHMIMNRAKVPLFYSDLLYDCLGAGRQFRRHVRLLHDFTLHVIRHRRLAVGAAAAANQGEPKNFLDVLLSAKTDDGQGLSDEDIREEVDTFMFEGHDTTAAAIAWALFLLAAHPHVQAEAHKELDQIFGSSLRPAAASDLRAMKFLECVVKETLRLYPSAALFGRQLSAELRLSRQGERDIVLPSGTCVYLHSFVTHRNADIYPEPERFDPSRFELQNCVGRHPFAYIPFSAGPPNCIGQKFAMMELKVVLSTVLRRFRLSTHLAPHELLPALDMITRPAQPVLIQFDYREV